MLRPAPLWNAPDTHIHIANTTMKSVYFVGAGGIGMSAWSAIFCHKVWWWPVTTAQLAN